jgi:hypothetical protein
MKLFEQLQPDNISNIFLYAVIMFANIDYMGITDYLIKAVIGGLVWFAFKLLQDYYSPKVKQIARNLLRKKENEGKE